MKLKFFSFILFLLIFLGACQNHQEKAVTRKIQYDVTIKSPNLNYDWWIQNVSGPQREDLVKMILQGALDGKYQAYDYFYKPISRTKVAQILFDTLHREIQEKNPPYRYKDTLIVSRITWKNIEKLRFMEEWSVNPKNLLFIKKVVGIAPVAKITDAGGNVRWQPLFWIFPDKNYLKKMNKNSMPGP